MKTKEVGNFYESLPRKELQELSKKCGLSPHKTRSNLVNSLNSYFKNLSSTSPVKRSSINSTPLTPQLQFGAELSDTAVARKDSCGIVTCRREADHREIHSVKSNDLGGCEEAERINKASGVEISKDFGCSTNNIRKSSRLSSKRRETSCLQNVFQCDKNGFKCRVDSPKISSGRNNLAFATEVGVGNIDRVQNRNVNDGACPAQNAFVSSMKSSTSVPSFKFYVKSEQGINVFIDLNSSQSDWSKRLENEVCFCQNLQKNKFHNFRQELEYLGSSNKQMKNSPLWSTDSDNGMNCSHVQTDSSPNSIKRENYHGAFEFDQPDGGDGSFGFPATPPCSAAVEMSAHSEEEKKVPLLSRLSSDVQNQMVSDTESCPRDGGKKCVDSNVVPQVKLTCISVLTLISEGPRSFDAVEDQISKLGNEDCGNIALKNTCSLENSGAVYPGCSEIGSLPIQLSEVASHQKDSSCSFEDNCFVNVVDAIHNSETGDGGLANFSEVNHDTCWNHTPAYAEEWVQHKFLASSCCMTERSNVVNGTGASDPLKKRSEDSVTGGGPKRKRHESEIDNSCGQQDGRILRSAKRLVGQVLLRRSMRLISKVVPDAGHSANELGMRS